MNYWIWTDFPSAQIIPVFTEHLHVKFARKYERSMPNDAEKPKYVLADHHIRNISLITCLPLLVHVYTDVVWCCVCFSEAGPTKKSRLYTKCGWRAPCITRRKHGRTLGLHIKRTKCARALKQPTHEQQPTKWARAMCCVFFGCMIALEPHRKES